MPTPKNLNLSIPSACHEKPENMDKNALGSFCRSCTKQVVDFSGMSDSQIIAYFSRNSGRVCGQFRPEQLKNYTLPKPVLEPSRRKSLVIGSFITAASAIATGLSVSPLIASAIELETTEQTENAQLEELVQTKSDTIVVIKGKILDDSNGDPIPFAQIKLQETAEEFTSDMDGSFAVVIDEYLLRKEKRVTITFNLVGYEAVNLEIDLNKPLKNLEIAMQRLHLKMGEVMMVRGKVACTPE